jgi:hypothetical protein
MNSDSNIIDFQIALQQRTHDRSGDLVIEKDDWLESFDCSNESEENNLKGLIFIY